MAKCKGCGASIIWAVNENGKRVPLDAKAPIYVLLATASLDEERCVRDRSPRYVSHFSTCPKANEFSGSKRKPKEKK